MTVKEAYVIFFGPQDRDINETIVRKELTRDNLRKKFREMQKKFHSDANIKNIKNQKEYNAISIDINVAYEILDGYLKNPNYTNPHLNTKSAYREYLSKRIIVVEKLRKEYIEKFNRAIRLREYSLINKYIELINTYYEETSYCQDLLVLYNKQEEFRKKSKLIMDELSKNGVEHKRILKYISEEKVLDRETLENELKEFLQEDYDMANDREYASKCILWLRYKLGKNEKEIDEKISVIYNLKSKISERFSKAKELFLKKEKIKSQKIVIDIYKRLVKAASIEEIIELIQLFETYEYDNRELKKNCIMKYDSNIAILESLKTNEIDEEWVKKFEKEIEDMITKDNLEDLNNPVVYDEVCEAVTLNNRDSQKNLNKLNSKIKQEKLNISVQLTRYKELISDISSFINGEKPKKIAISNIIPANSSNLFSNFKDTKKEVYRRIKEVIPIYRNCIITYYADKVNNFDEVNYLLHTEYLYYKKNIDRPEVLEKYYLELKNVYDNINNIRRFNDESTELNAKTNLINIIETTKRNNDQMALVLPKYLEETYQNRYNLDINTLYELYARIEEIYLEQFKIHDSNKSKKSQR